MIGTKLADRYEIVAELGRGGMGVVYRAHDPRLNREVAVKCVPPQQLSPDAEHRFQREAQVVAQMDHPAIVSIHDFGHHDGSLFFVMPLVQGTNLRAFLRHEEARLGDILEVGIQVAEALDYSHARGVVHRDIKPENVMVTREEGAGIRVRVMDFGLARASSESRLTRTGTLIGTLAYLSPEQVAAKEVDGRSDVYALGTVLYECVAGGPPFSGEAQSVLYRVVHEFPQSPREAGAEIDEELEAIILSCLQKEPGRRPQRAGEVAEALKRYRSRLRDSDRERAVAGLTQSMQAPRVAQAPLVGRASELAELQKRLNAAVAGECQFVVVSGEPGVGKTRLLDEIESLARARGIRVLHGRSVERDRSFPYQGFCDAIQEYFRYKDSGSSAAADFSDLAPDLLALFPMLTEIVEIRDAASGGAQTARSGASGAENQTQVFELLARTLTRIAGGKPLVLAMEDLHAAEVSLEALQYIVRRLGPTPTLVLGSYRTSEVDRRHPLTRVLEGFRGDRRFAAIPLGPLPPAEHRAFVETLVGGAGLTESLAQRLYEGTEGNPFFTKELVRSLLGSGAIAADATGQWTISGEAALSADAMPATIQEAVEGRIQRLPEELRQLLATASVLGRSFDVRDLEALAEGEVEDALDRLLVEGYLEEQREARGDVLAFSSGVVRDVLYGSLSPRKRRSLHRRCAERLETRHAGRLERVLPQLVHHYFNGDVPEKTVEHGLRLAGSSLDAFSAEEAARSARMALSFLDDEWEGDRGLEAEARLLLARAHRMGGDIEGALREAAAAVAVHEREGRTAAAASTLLFAAETAWQARRSDEAGRFAEKGLVVARQAGEPAVLRPLLSLAATLANLRGDYDRAKALMEEGEALGARPRGGAGEVGVRGRAAGGGPRQPGEVDRARHHPDERGSGGGGQRLRDAARHQPRRKPDPRPVREVGAARGGTCLPPHPAARRPLLRRAAADRDRRQGLVRGLGPPDPGGAAVGPERRAGGGRAPRRDVRGDPGPRRAGRPRAGDPAPRAAAHLPGAAHRGEHRGHEARRRRQARWGRGRSASPRARPTGSSSSGAPSTGGSPGRCSTSSSSAGSRAPTPSRRATARARWTSPATSCPRTSRRSSATRACGGGWWRRRRRTPTSSSSTAAAAPPPPAPSCAGPWRGRCAPRTSSGGRSAASRSRRRASSRRPCSGTTPAGGAPPSPARKPSPC